MDEERVIEEAEQQKKKRTRLVAKKHTGFQCSFCGNYTTDINEYYSSLTNILLTRFINLLKSDNGESYFEGVIDCIHAVFGNHNPVMRKALKLEGQIDAFEQRHGKMDEASEHRLRCDYCNQWKWEHLITIDNSKVARLICEDCLLNTKHGDEK
jgi:transcription elongation factor Elf1